VHAFLSSIYAVIGIADPRSQSRSSEAESFVEALGDIWKRITRSTASEWRKRFVRHVGNYIDGCVWEANNRKIAQIPSRAVFLSMRSYTSTIYQFWDFIEFADGLLLPDTVLDNPMVVELARTGNLIVSLANDIFSLHKETSSGDIHNLVIVLQQEEALTREEACLRTIDLHDAQVRHFCTLEGLLPSFGTRIDQDLAHYLDGMRIWISATYDWSSVTPRYND
jgi:hypothetical protein